MADQKPEIAFESPEELQQICRLLALRLHYLNRVAMGESKFAFVVAEALDGIGKVFAQDLNNTDVQKSFGDGYSRGTIPESDQLAALLARAFPDLKDRLQADEK